MTRLSVNVNKLATLRNARGGNLPDVSAFARKILSYGAHGITVHPRPDERHIRRSDVPALSQVVTSFNQGSAKKAEYNIEGYPSDDFLTLLAQIRPDQATLVPDPPEALTSNAGWDLNGHQALLSEVVHKIKRLGSVRVSLFVDPFQFDEAQGQALLAIRPDHIELFTEKFADAFSNSHRAQVTAEYVRVATWAREHGIGVNAGHDLNQQNLGYLISQIPWLHEVSIGHALICEALEQGMQTTIANYLMILEGGK